jgi:hypothetical protein
LIQVRIAGLLRRMLLFSLAAALLLQTPSLPLPVPLPAPPALPTAEVFDTPATRELVERVIRESGEIPEGLRDFEARVRTTMQLSLAPDSSLGGELPISVDELAGEIRWQRPDVLHQWVREHRTRVLVPAPYSLGSLLESPWVIPHLYGPTIEVLALSPGTETRRAGRPSAVHPFGAQGPLYYRYVAGDTIRIRIQQELVTLVPVTVRPRVAADTRTRPLVVGTFYIDVSRAAVAQARFGFMEPRRGLALGRTGVFLELENALWEGRYWLPFRQRREIQIASALFGGAVAARIVNTVSGYRLNTGWEPGAPGRARLFLAAPTVETTAELGPPTVAAEAAAYDIADFADLRRLAIDAAQPDPALLRVGLRYERSDHFFRYNRVEGAFLGLGGRVEPGDPLDRRWEVYGTGGWAFAEGTARGELVARWHLDAPRVPPRGIERGLSAGIYRRLRDTRLFPPTFQWDLLYILPALLGGSDLRDYYDAAGAELSFATVTGPWRGRLTTRWEQQDSVVRNTERFLFGEAEEFPPLAAVQPGTHAALEAEGSFTRGPGAFGMGNSLVATLRAEAGLGDFEVQRLTALLSFRRAREPFTLATRIDAGHAWGVVPPQMLFRFGDTEGLSGYAVNEFGGSSAALGRARLLVGIPPRNPRPLARSGPFFIPPLRPALVLLGEAGWSEVSQRSRPQLDLLGAVPTDGVRASVGAGLSIFDDALTLEWIRPLDDDRRPRWYFGLTRWY